jgi:twitching motility protein PilU
MEREQAIRTMRELLSLLVERRGSDLFITVGFPPALKVDGRIMPVSKVRLTPENARGLTHAIMNERQLREFEATKECNFAIAPTGVGRFRVNAFIQQGHTGMVLRTIETRVPTLEQLGLPTVMQDIALTRRGLVIMVGGTGSGKSTSLAAMINHRNEHSQGHIVTLEDPIEFIHPHKHCIVTQREIGVDTEDWGIALKNALRQAPDVILLGEIRDRETMEFGLAFAETGHLAMATLHANSANQALDRIINFFPADRHAQLFMDMSLNVRGIIAQRLIKRANGQGRVAAVEVMLNSPLMADLMQKGEIPQLKDLMSRSNELGMKTFDQALFDLYENGDISYEEGLRSADSVNELRLRIKLESRRGPPPGVDGTSTLSLEETEPGPGTFGPRGS